MMEVGATAFSPIEGTRPSRQGLPVAVVSGWVGSGRLCGVLPDFLLGPRWVATEHVRVTRDKRLKDFVQGS